MDPGRPSVVVDLYYVDLGSYSSTVVRRIRSSGLGTLGGDRVVMERESNVDPDVLPREW